MHRETASRIRAAVGWVNEPEQTDRPGTVRPDGCMDLMWIDGELLVAGADTGPRPIPRTAGTKFGLRFAPGHLPLALGLPAHELADQQVRLADLGLDRSRARAMAAAEQELHDIGASVAVLEDGRRGRAVCAMVEGSGSPANERTGVGRSTPMADIRPDLDPQFVETLVSTRAEVAGDVLQIGVHTWAIHGSILVDGEVLLADYDDPDEATSMLARLADDADTHPSGDS